MGGVDLDRALVKGWAPGGETALGGTESLDCRHKLEGAA